MEMGKSTKSQPQPSFFHPCAEHPSPAEILLSSFAPPPPLFALPSKPPPPPPFPQSQCPHIRKRR